MKTGNIVGNRLGDGVAGQFAADGRLLAKLGHLLVQGGDQLGQLAIGPTLDRATRKLRRTVGRRQTRGSGGTRSDFGIRHGQGIKKTAAAGGDYPKLLGN